MRISIKDLILKLSSQLAPSYPDPESKQIAFMLLEHELGIGKQDQMLNTTLELNPVHEKHLEDMLGRLLRGEPIQYVLGTAHFYGRDYQVNTQVLIPRPETEELVAWILDDHHQKDLKIMDIGTGSGCLAVTLALELKNALVYGIDISQEALQIARRNADRLRASVNFLRTDILQELPPWQNLDIIICNPPYVPQSDRATIQIQVKQHEPHAALFVPDGDPLIFYRRLAEIGPQLLKKGGSLYMEIYHEFGSQVAALFESPFWKYAEIRTDLQGKERMVKTIRH